MISTLPDISKELIALLISVASAFLIGMEIFIKTPEESRKYLFGSERTFAFIALMGFVLLKTESFIPHTYIVGLVITSAFLLTFYYNKIQNSEARGMTIVFITLLVYLFPLLFQQFPLWFSLLTITLIMVLVEVKQKVKDFSRKVLNDDFITLAKFVFLSGVILPLVPDREIITGIPVSPYKLWLAIVVISAISYLSYLLRKYVFPNAGLLMTGILGGLYSSTATTFIIARKSKEQIDAPSHYAAAILAASSLMFLRVFILVVIFNMPLSLHLLPYFAVLFGISTVTTFVIYRSSSKQLATPQITTQEIKHQNPLELGTAFIFGVLYVVFSLLTQYTMQYYGHSGLNLLSFVVGFTDIDPFLLNMFQGKYAGITTAIISTATLQAIVSNNVLKTCYAVTMGDNKIRKYILIGFSVIIGTNAVLLFFV